MSDLKIEQKPHGEFWTFSIKVTMKKRWVPQFLAMLKYMQQLGGIGSSRVVSIYSDGDGDFRPEFQWDANLPDVAKPIAGGSNGNHTYDAG